jgi:Rod binding domain-containing protein
MSGLTGIASLPAVLPAEVRDGGKDAKQAYSAALGFERMLVKQLTKSLTDSSAIGGGEGGENGQSGSPAAYREMISDGIADAITQGGGIGLAMDLYAEVAPAQQVDGGTGRARTPAKVDDRYTKQVRPEGSK